MPVTRDKQKQTQAPTHSIGSRRLAKKEEEEQQVKIKNVFQASGFGFCQKQRP
jgi:hypothetical protein